MTRPSECLTGVYTITNCVTGKVYVGSTMGHFSERWRQHIHLLRAGKHHSNHLQNAWSKFWEISFTFEILEECSPEHCTSLEQYWINQLMSANPAYGYNAVPVAGSRQGYRHSEEVKLKLGAHSASWKRSESHVQALKEGYRNFVCQNGAPRKGRKLSDSHKEALRQANLGNQRGKVLSGRKLSDETKEKLRIARIAYLERSREC